MKQKLFYLLPILVLTGCGQVSYKNTSLSPEERADLLVKDFPGNYSMSPTLPL